MSYNKDGRGSLFDKFLEESPMSYRLEDYRLGLIDNSFRIQDPPCNIPLISFSSYSFKRSCSIVFTLKINKLERGGPCVECQNTNLRLEGLYKFITKGIE